MTSAWCSEGRRNSIRLLVGRTAVTVLSRTGRSHFNVPHILLIEDDAGLREMIGLCLLALNHEVTEAPDGRQGLARFRERRPDLVITDLVMPDQDGLGVLMELRRISPETPIIVISGGPRSELYRGMAAKLGAQRVLAKPFRVEELIAAVTATIASSPR